MYWYFLTNFLATLMPKKSVNQAENNPQLRHLRKCFWMTPKSHHLAEVPNMLVLWTILLWYNLHTMNSLTAYYTVVFSIFPRLVQLLPGSNFRTFFITSKRNPIPTISSHCHVPLLQALEIASVCMDLAVQATGITITHGLLSVHVVTCVH